MRTRAATAPRRASRQRGGITIAMVFAVIVGLLLLAVTQLGYAFYMRREMQKAADLAALSAVQVLGMGQAGDCARAAEAGRRAALANLPALFDTFTADDVTVQCKVWDPSARGRFGHAPARRRRRPAAQCHARRRGPDAGRCRAQLLRRARRRHARVGGRRRHGSALPSRRSRWVRACCGWRRAGCCPNCLPRRGPRPRSLDVLDAAGAASADITPSGLLQALGLPLSVASGVGTPEQLAAVNNLSLGTLLQATVTAIDKGGDTGHGGGGGCCAAP
ncbi:pilus assembly protein TadG-related protein [Achromobacter sp. DMS1]|uniref:pilus assembly protein TadG-related protein n=1 Tax=Achromobacter sp. DMS1 TaxID=1688405 RepID=UPI000AF0AF85|nr:pilus assembly protein TadG-related protein [Achromobacter sp. DMS1]